MMSRLMLRGSLRYYRRHPWQALLVLAGIALGVAVVVAVDAANQSARKALALSVETVSGGSTHRLVGGPAGVPQRLLRDLRVELGIHASAPVVTAYVTLGGRTFTLLGIDPVSEIALDRYGLLETPSGGVDTVMLSEGLFMSPAAARELEVSPGAPLSVGLGGRTRSVPLAGLLTAETGEGLLIADIATAQVLLARGPILDRIDLVLAPADASRVAAWLPPGLTLVESEQRNRSLARMTETFHLNLTAMSLLALLVGGLLIYNTITFSVLQRRRSWGVFRGLGGTRGELNAVILLETLVLGLVGTLVGLALGLALASGLVRLVLRTVNDLYFVLTVSGFSLDWFAVVRGVFVGVGVSLVTAWLPARAMGREHPAALLRTRDPPQHGIARRPWLALAGLTLLMCGAWLVTVEGERSLELGFLALAMQVIGLCALVPALVSAALWAVLRAFRGMLGPVSRLALAGVRSGLGRTGLAVAALTVAVAATVGMGIMVTSFRGSLEAWLGQTLNGDIYLSAAITGPPGRGLPPGFVADVAALPGVSRVAASRHATVETDIGAVELTVSDDGGVADELIIEHLNDGIELWRRGAGILISEPLSRHQGLAPGDQLTFTTPEGPREMQILGVFRDYRSTRGTALLARQRYRELWSDDGIDGLVIYLAAEEASPTPVLERIKALAMPLSQAVNISASGEIRRRSLAVFEQTFAVTRALRLLTIIVAFVGVFGALMLLQLERMRQLAILRATGMTSRQIAGLVMMQTAAMGLLAGLFSLPLGWLMAQVLIHVINVRAFGWTLSTQTPVGLFGEALLLALAAAILAGCYPAWRAGRVPPAQVLRDE